MTGVERLLAVSDLVRGVDPEEPDRTAVTAAAVEVASVIAGGLDAWPWRVLPPAFDLRLRLASYGEPEPTVWRMGRAEPEALCRQRREFTGLVASPASEAA